MGDEVTDYRYVQVTTTIDSREGAEAMARSAVETRLAACAQVSGPIHSTYWWEGAIDSADEWYVVFKTTAERYPELERHIRERHSYEVPEIVLTPILAGNPAYLSWIHEETTPRS
ncbi:MAG TPA: divalent-cation tolerance protein CutA [Micromonospora sp.]